MASNMPRAYEPPQQPYMPREHPVIEAARKSGADVDTMLKNRDVDGISAAAQKADPGFSTDQGVQYLDDFASMMGKDLSGAQPNALSDRGLNRGWGNNPPMNALQYQQMPNALRR